MNDDRNAWASSEMFGCGVAIKARFFYQCSHHVARVTGACTTPLCGVLQQHAGIRA